MPKLSAWFAAHQKEVLIGGVGGVAAIGLAVAKRKSSSGGGGSSTSGTAAGTGTYDSTGTDLANYVQPQIDTLAAALASQGKILDKLQHPSTKPPAKRPKPPAAWRAGLSASQVAAVTKALGPDPTSAQLAQFGRWVSSAGSAAAARTPAKPAPPVKSAAMRVSGPGRVLARVATPRGTTKPAKPAPGTPVPVGGWKRF